MSRERVDYLELLRSISRSAADRRKTLLALYGLLIFLLLGLLVVAAGRIQLLGDPAAQLETTFLRPLLALTDLCAGGFAAGRWGLLAGVGLGVVVAALAVNSFFGLAVSRMAAIELTCDRRAEVDEALRFARTHWWWAFLAPASLLAGALLLLGAAALLLGLGRASESLLLVAAPLALILAIGAVVLVAGILAGGILAGPTIATEWSDAFDAITRVYGYSFAHAHRVILYRMGGALALAFAAVTTGFRALLVLGGFHLALLVGMGSARTKALYSAILLEPPGGLPFPATLGAWTLVTCVVVFLTLQVARLLVHRLVLVQGIYLLLRLRIDKVALTTIDGYRPDDSSYDPTAQGFELVEVEEELSTE